MTEFYLIVIAFITFLSSSLCASITLGMSVSLYPTNIRATATCFIFMFGRIGGLTGANLVGALLEHNCTQIFNIYALLSLSKSREASECHNDEFLNEKNICLFCRLSNCFLDDKK